ncbi:MAG: hypothetical protein RI841_04805 [Halomonas sp.]|nr:hypothetical protein [Halomonas sp.]MDR9438807.1 hypothetical protein [Halomonas sp.]
MSDWKVDYSSFDAVQEGCANRYIPYREDPETLPWQELDIDLVLECTGAFTTLEGLGKHDRAGAKRVIVSAPGKGSNIPSVVYGVNELDNETTACFSTASFTTNCIAPVVEILHRHIGVKKAMLTTVHAYTASQGIVDTPSKKMARCRTAGLNMIPTTTVAPPPPRTYCPNTRVTSMAPPFGYPSPPAPFPISRWLPSARPRLKRLTTPSGRRHRPRAIREYQEWPKIPLSRPISSVPPGRH